MEIATKLVSSHGDENVMAEVSPGLSYWLLCDVGAAGHIHPRIGPFTFVRPARLETVHIVARLLLLGSSSDLDIGSHRFLPATKECLDYSLRAPATL
jgi:hypothetical protein